MRAQILSINVWMWFKICTNTAQVIYQPTDWPTAWAGRFEWIQCTFKRRTIKMREKKRWNQNQQKNKKYVCYKRVQPLSDKKVDERARERDAHTVKRKCCALLALKIYTFKWDAKYNNNISISYITAVYRSRQRIICISFGWYVCLFSCVSLSSSTRPIS